MSRKQKVASQHTFGDDAIVDFLNVSREWNSYEKDVPYHPQSPLDGDKQCECLRNDLIHESDAIAEAARKGEVVFDVNYEIGDPNGLNANADLVLGPPAEDVQSTVGAGFARGEPAEMWFVADAKAIMTEYGKARKNRKSKLNQLAAVTELKHPRAISAGIILLNTAERFDSPKRDADEITKHPDDLDRILRQTIGKFEVKGTESSLDLCGIVPVDHTNLVQDVGETSLATKDPAPDSGDSVHYRTFVREAAQEIENEFL